MLTFTLLKKLALPTLVALSFLFYKFFPKVKQDNPVEETIEYVIKLNTGEDIDLSPDTPE